MKTCLQVSSLFLIGLVAGWLVSSRFASSSKASPSPDPESSSMGASLLQAKGGSQVLLKSLERAIRSRDFARLTRSLESMGYRPYNSRTMLESLFDSLGSMEEKFLLAEHLKAKFGFASSMALLASVRKVDPRLSLNVLEGLSREWQIVVGPAFLSELAASHPDLALAYSHMGTREREALYEGWAKTDAASAWEHLGQNPAVKQEALRSKILSQWVKSDPEGLVALMEANPELEIGALEIHDAEAFWTQYEGLRDHFGGDPQVALQWLVDHSNNEGITVLTGIIVQSYGEDPAALVDILEQLKEIDLESKAFTVQKGMGRALASGAREHGIEWLSSKLKQLPENYEFRVILRAFGETWASLDRESLSLWLKENEKSPLYQDLTYRLAGEAFLENRERWVASLEQLEDGSHRDQMLLATIESLLGVADDFLAAAKLLDKVSDPEIREQKIPRLVWGFNSEEAMDWLEEQSDFSVSDEAKRRALSNWARSDSYTASQYIGKMEAGPLRDSALSTLIWSVSSTSPESALPWIFELSSTSQRQSRAKHVFARAEALGLSREELFSSKDLKPEQREQLRSLIGGDENEMP